MWLSFDCRCSSPNIFRSFCDIIVCETIFAIHSIGGQILCPNNQSNRTLVVSDVFVLSVRSIHTNPLWTDHSSGAIGFDVNSVPLFVLLFPMSSQHFCIDFSDDSFGQMVRKEVESLCFYGSLHCSGPSNWNPHTIRMGYGLWGLHHQRAVHLAYSQSWHSFRSFLYSLHYCFWFIHLGKTRLARRSALFSDSNHFLCLILTHRRCHSI